MNLISRLPRLWPLWLAGALVLLLGMRLDVMEVDSAQYASIAREMLHNGEWLEVYEHGKTYNSRGFPDKPPLLFWAGAAGMWLLGENNWGFKLIATLVGLLGIFAVGRWAALLFGEQAKTPARLFYSFNAGFMLMHMDLRTDAMLVHFIAIGCWQLEVYLRSERKSAFFWAFTSLALGMLAKGPVALIAVLAAFGPEALLRRDWKRLFRWEWLVGSIWLLLLLSPMLYGLYTQWGWEKGIKYYFWTQSFGRITGENVWENNLPITYLLENFAWAFLPWVPLFGIMLVNELKQRFAGLKAPGLAVPAFGFVLMLAAMSLSKYKLPHYVYVCWPFAAVWLAGWWTKNEQDNRWGRLHLVIGALIVAFTVFLLFWAFDFNLLTTLSPLFLWLVLLLWQQRALETSCQKLLPAAWAMLLFGLAANGLIYPSLLPYQSAAMAGKLSKQSKAPLPLYHHLENDESIHTIHFYSGQIVEAIHPQDLPPVQKLQVYTTPGLAALWDNTPRTRIIARMELPYFKVSSLTLDFIHSPSREQQVEKRVLLTVIID
jgi:4-amino-4-deoxy-L-arabinose transferase-like glycosyltransferase